MNNIFIKNLAALSPRNPDLAQKLQTHIPTELPKLVQENGTYNILYKEKLVHNAQSPLGEANEIFAMSENIPVSIHLVFGLGLGYLFQLASLKSQGTVILYEPDLNILWLSFTLVDFSNDILKPNVFITSTFDEAAQVIYQKSGMKNSPVLLSLPSQREFYPQEFEELVKKLKETIGSFSLDLKFTQQKFYPSLKLMMYNLPHLFEELPLVHFKDTYKGKTAVIVSAGPTLDRNIETLKKNRDKYILFTVGTAAKTLFSNGIKPDFIVIIETYNSARQLQGLDLSDVNFITEPYSHCVYRKFGFKNFYSHISSNTPVNHFWAEISGEDIDEYFSKGTVSYTALNCARILGCSKIVLVGQDLAYIEGQCYSKDSVYKDLSCEYNKETNRWEIIAKDFEKFAMALSASESPAYRERTAANRLKNLNASLYYVKGINGDMIPTESVYAAFIKPLQEFVQNFNDREYINTSLVGAQIDGFENKSLEEALEGSEVVGDIELKTDFQYKKDEILDSFRLKLDELKSSLALISDGTRMSRNINNELKRHRMINADVLKLLKKLSENYLILSSNFANKSKMFDFIITADRIDLDYEMKMLKEFTLENVLRLNEKLSQFYENAEKRILEIEGLFNENFDTAGK